MKHNAKSAIVTLIVTAIPTTGTLAIGYYHSSMTDVMVWASIFALAFASVGTLVAATVYMSS
jgi:hypothetical protein